MSVVINWTSEYELLIMDHDKIDPFTGVFVEYLINKILRDPDYVVSTDSIRLMLPEKYQQYAPRVWIEFTMMLQHVSTLRSEFNINNGVLYFESIAHGKWHSAIEHNIDAFIKRAQQCTCYCEVDKMFVEALLLDYFDEHIIGNVVL